MATSAPVSVETCIIETVIRAYHIYKEIWAASIGEVLLCARETANVHDPYAVAVILRSITVGHVPRALSAVCSLFFRSRWTRDTMLAYFQRGEEVGVQSF